MKAFYNIILILAAAAALASCTIDEIDSVGHKKEVKFVVRPTSLISCNVSDISTKVPYETKAASDFESDIYSAYFLVFDKDGNRIDYRILDVEDSNIPSQIVTPNVEGTISACFIANVPEEYAASLEEIDDLYNKPLDFSYITSTDGSEECVAIPDLDGIPMFGWVTGYSIAENLGATTPISLKRLFAKVNVSFQMNLSEDWLDTIRDYLIQWFGTGDPDPWFRLDSYTITNLPTQVKLMHQKNNDGSYVNSNYDWFSDPVTVASESPAVIKNTDGGISFSFYVPEYILNPQKTGNSDQTKKTPEELLGAYDRPLFLTFHGFYNDGMNPAELDYNIYLGEDATNSFSLFGNNIYSNVLNIKNTSHLSVGVDNRVDVRPLSLIEFYGESANCYIISKPGTYIIDAFEGVVKSPSGEPDFTGTPELIANDGNNKIDFDEDNENDGRIIFTVNDGTGTVSHGNAVIGIYNGGIKWSWHIWFTPETQWSGIGSHTYSTDATMMNRNLGSSGATKKDGTYYKWGDKNPYFTSSNGYSGYHGGGYSYGDWSDSEKSVTDPCPPGYKVPSTNVWNATASLGDLAYQSNYFVYQMLSPYVEYPYSGYIDENDKHVDKYSVDINDQTPEDVNIKSEDIPKENAKTYRITDYKGRETYNNHYKPVKYYGFKFRMKSDFTSGCLHASNGYFIYGINDNGLDNILTLFLSDKLTIESLYRSYGTLVEGEHYYSETTTNGVSIFKTVTETRTYTDLEPYWGEGELIKYSDLGISLRADFKNQLRNYFESMDEYKPKVYKITSEPDITNGYPVRCVLETSSVK